MAIVIGASTMQDGPLLDRLIAPGQRAVLLHNSYIEHRPLERQELDGHRIRFGGGDVQTDVAMLLLIDDAAPLVRTVAWTRANAFSLGLVGGPSRDREQQLNRINVFDVMRHGERIFIAHSVGRRVNIDVVRQAPGGEWTVETVLELFEQRDSETIPHLVRSGRFVFVDDEWFLCFEIEHLSKTMEIWHVTFDVANAIDDPNAHLIEAVLDAKAAEGEQSDGIRRRD